MKRRTFLFGALASGTAACHRDRRPRLNVYNWSAYVAPDTIPNFEKEFGVRVRYVTYESNEEMLAQVITGNSGWDIVFPTHNRVAPMSTMGLLAPMDHRRLKNLGNLELQFQSPAWDLGLRWSMPYMWFGTGIAFNRSLSPAPTAWADLWSPRLKGRLTMLDDPEDVIGAGLKKLGLPFESIDPNELRSAQRALVEQKSLVRAYLNAEVRDQLVSGDVLAAQLWSTTAAQALDAGPSLDFVFPAEGFPLYCDSAVILRESRRQELAHVLLDYLLRPPVSAGIAQSTLTAPPTPPAGCCCRKPFAPALRFIRPPMSCAAASGPERSRRRRKGYATASGPKSKQRDSPQADLAVVALYRGYEFLIRCRNDGAWFHWPRCALVPGRPCEGSDPL